MKKSVIVLALVAFSSFAFAENHGGEAFEMSDKAWKFIFYFLGMGLAVFGGTAAQSKAASVALEGIARNPSAADKLQTPMILALALMESLVIFMLITTFLLN